MLDVVLPEKIPGRVVPRVGFRDRGAPPAGDGSTVGTDAASLSRKTYGGTADSIQTLGGGDSVKEGVRGSSSVGGAAGGGGEEGGLEKTERGRRPVRKGVAAARKKRGSRSERFFEVSATSQVKVLVAN